MMSVCVGECGGRREDEGVDYGIFEETRCIMASSGGGLYQ